MGLDVNWRAGQLWRVLIVLAPRTTVEIEQGLRLQWIERIELIELIELIESTERESLPGTTTPGSLINQ